MSWIFGVKTPSPNLPPSPPGGIGGDQNSSDGGPRNKPPSDKDAASRMAYTFYSAALERAARAAKELEGSRKSNFLFIFGFEILRFMIFYNFELIVFLLFLLSCHFIFILECDLFAVLF